MKLIKPLLNNIRNIQSHILGFIIFEAIIIFVPTFYNVYYLPKLILLLFGSLILLLLEAINLLQLNKKYYFYKSDFLLIVFFIFNWLAWFFSVNRLISFWGFYPYEGLNLFYIPAFLIIAWIYKRFSKNEKEMVLKYISFANIFASVYVLYQFRLIIRPGGFEGHPVAQAGVIGLGLLLIFITNLNFLSKTNRYIIKIFVISLHLVALYILNSSTVWVSLIFAFAGSVFFKLISLKKKFNKIKIAVITIMIIGLVVGLFLLIKNEEFSIYRRITETKGIVKMISSEYIVSSQKFKNLLLGHGQNTSGFIYPKYKLPPQKDDKEWQVLITNFHSHFFEMFFTTGTITVFIWILLFYLALKYAWQKKQFSYFAILIYLIVWSQLYLLLPTLHMITWIMLFYQQNNKKTFLLDKNRLLKILVGIIVLFFCVFTFIKGYYLVKAEIVFNKGNTNNAIKLAPYNDFYLKSLAQKSLQLLVFCESRKNKGFPECQWKNLNNSLKSAHENSKKAVMINSLNPESWALYGDITFKRFLFHASNIYSLRDEALNAEKKALEIDPTNPIYTDNIGLVYYDLGDYKKAEIYFLKANVLKPDYNQTLSHLMDTYEKLGDIEKKNFYKRKLGL